MVLRVFMFVLIVVVGFGCKPKEPVQPVNPTNPVATEEFSVSIDGVKWTPTNYTAHCSLGPSSTHSGHDTTIHIDAYDTIRKQKLSFYISGWNGETGSFNTPGGGNDYLLRFYFDKNTSSIIQGNYFTVSGNVKITKITSDHVQGIFEAVLKEDVSTNTLSFTSGIFNIPYKPL